MSNYNHIPLTDDSRFSGGVDIGDAQKIKGYYEIFEQFPVHYSLCRQEKTAPYPLCGTVSLRDSQDSVLHMKDSDGKEVPARLRITTKSTDPKEVKREIAEKAQILHTRFVGTGKAAGAYIPIEQLSFAEVINMYGAEYAQARSPHNDRRQKDWLDLLRHVAEGFAAIPCAKITQRQIGEFCEQLGETWYNKIREADFLMAYVAERRKYEQIANPFALYRESHAVSRNTQRLQQSAVSTDVLSRDEVEQFVALVLEHLGDPDYVGIGLLLGTGLEAKQVAALKHGNIYEDPDNKGSLILDYARRCQAIAHRRIPWKNEKMTSKFTAVAGGRQSVQTVNLEDDEKTVTATVRIALKPGETVRLSSNYGIHTKWSAESDGGSVTGSEA